MEESSELSMEIGRRISKIRWVTFKSLYFLCISGVVMMKAKNSLLDGCSVPGVTSWQLILFPEIGLTVRNDVFYAHSLETTESNRRREMKTEKGERIN